MKSKSSKKNKNKKYCCQCKKCGDKMPCNTNKKMIYCKCGLIAVDGCEDYTRIIGDKNDYILEVN